MDASASSRSDLNDVVGLFLKLEKSDFPTGIKQRNTVIKYTKLPEFDIDPKGELMGTFSETNVIENEGHFVKTYNTKERNEKRYNKPEQYVFWSTVTWSRESYSLQPRLRRIITLEEPKYKTSRSLNHDVIIPPKTMCTNISKRKIVTISEDDEYDLHPKFSREKKTNSVKTSNRSVEANFKEKQLSQRTTSRIINTVKYSKETRPSAKPLPASERNPVIPKSSYGNKKSKTTIDNLKSRHIKEKESVRSHRSVNPSKTSVSKNYVSPSESERDITAIKSKLYENVKIPKRYMEKSQPTKSLTPQKSKAAIFNEIHNSPLTVIHVPLDEKYLRPKIKSLSNTSVSTNKDEVPKNDCATDAEKVLLKDMSVSTEPQPQKIDQVTDMHNLENQIYYKCMKSTDVQTEVIKEAFDSLRIPDVTLTTDKTKVEYLNLHSESLPNLRTPSFKIIPHKRESNSVDTNYCKSTSYIISRATLTYTTKQKINFEVVGSNDNTYSNHTPSPLAYPMNVVSVFKNEMKQDLGESNTKGHKRKDNTGIQKETTNYINEIKSLNCSYVSNSDKLMKPSDIISTIRVNNGLSQSDYICEQFQRELNFIESFFESLQYLESCSLSDTCFNDGKIDSLVKNSSLLNADFDVKISDYDNLISKLEDGETASDSETMASKNLFLLNILIRDEQRRAKNLLFVLKRREDALKDFAKSQILYLENKKKNYSQDFSALQKKQRGALLKLQHECGEMQRMRKALLTLSERRKIALMRTKKDLELKLKNNVDVERIILSKKKVKRNSGGDRTAPLKCFDLSSSGCEESSGARPVSEGEPRASAEKSIQTGESALTAPADEHAIAVDGTYLNILFQNLSLPQIFSGGKQYEVNEEALRNIVNSTTQRERDANGADVDRLMEQLTSHEERSSSPSTARSLLDELEHYYRGLTEERTAAVCELTDNAVQATPDHEEPPTPVVLAPAGPLPVPAGAARVDPPIIDASAAYVISSSSSSPAFIDSTSVSSSSLCGIVPSISSLTAPAQCEAEELRRQQLAIEKEIKELEQQQCRLVVREIPDKPPPPYTPPADPRPPAHPRLFTLDAETTARVADLISKTEPVTAHTEAFDVFLQDFCAEAVERRRKDLSDAPWDACNLQPHSPAVDPNNLVSQTTVELTEVLMGAVPTVLTGVSSRRSDHIDDILFAEWRRVEPSWTSLHSDEATVKNQIFESIFQRVLTETVDEYKRTLRCDKRND